MTVPSTDNRRRYSGNGSTTEFEYPKGIFEDSDLTVYEVDDSTGAATLQTLGSDYTVTNAGSANGGDVVFTTAPASGKTVIILREVDVTQNTKLRNQRAFTPVAIEKEFDRRAMVDLQLQDGVNRSLKLSKSDLGAEDDMTLPAKSERAGKLSSFDDDGKPSVTTQQSRPGPTFKSVSDLRADNPANNKDGDIGELAGYYGIATPGGGPVVWHADSTDDDDGGITFKPDNIDSADPGRWKRRVDDGVIRTSMFGASSSDLNELLSTLSADYRRIVIDAPSTIDNAHTIFISGKSNFTLNFESPLEETVIRDTPWLELSNCSKFNLEFYEMQGAESFQSWDFVRRPRILMEGCQWSSVYVRFVQGCSSIVQGTNCKSSAFKFENAVGILTSEKDTTGNDDRLSVLIRLTSGEDNCVFDSKIYQFGNPVVQGGQGQRLTISRNVMVDSVDNGVYISSGDYCKIEGNTISNVLDGSGIKARGRKNIVIGNSIKGARTSISITGSGFGDSEGFNSFGVVVEGNSVEDFALGLRVDPFDDPDGNPQYVCSIAISGNTFKNKTANQNVPVIRLVETESCLFNNNCIEDADSGDYVVGVIGDSARKCKNINISNNTFRNIVNTEIIRSIYTEDLNIQGNNIQDSGTMPNVLLELRYTNRAVVSGNRVPGRIDPDSDFTSTYCLITSNIVNINTPQNDSTNVIANEIVIP